jgi:hypothetical protein
MNGKIFGVGSIVLTICLGHEHAGEDLRYPPQPAQQFVIAAATSTGSFHVPLHFNPMTFAALPEKSEPIRAAMTST